MNMKYLKLLSLCLLLVSGVLSAYAQNDTRSPGLYAVNGEESVKLDFLPGITSNGRVGILGVVEFGNSASRFKGETSDVKVSGNEFALVIDPDRKNVVRTLKKYEIFIKTMTPDNMLIVPLVVEDNWRIYDKGLNVNGFNTEFKELVAFTWERISDNSFRILAEGLVPGEYAFIFRVSPLSPFDFSGAFDFTYIVEDASSITEE